MSTSEGRGGARRAAVAAVLAAGMAGCVAPGLERGFSSRDAEWTRSGSPDDFAIVSASHMRAVVSALGKQVAIEPADGFCLAREAIETSDRSAFLLLGDCALEDPDGAVHAGAEGALDLPPGVPGIITVSISGDPGFSRRGAGAEDLSDLQAFLGTEEGRELLGRGGDSDQVAVVDTRRIGDILYVLVEDADGSVPVLAPRFWRAFVELNERLAVITVSGFRDRPLPEEEMLRYLGDQVRQLKVANSEPLNDIAVQVAEGPQQDAAPLSATPAGAPPATLGDEVEELAAAADVSPAARPRATGPTSVIVSTEAGEQDFWPLPQRREIGSAGQDGPSAEDAERLAVVALPGRRDQPRGWDGIAASTMAPAEAPAAPPRP